ncbi:hypothetical protein [Streptomyces sp. WAC06614]|uniref:hypothetical protein n=1 Tax=Streptomyces sp. WAC06614 TaxID=2487416 RepID=UPI00163C6DEC|nr:hypothetical protein [Streptomyces sp. WAC06614]
MSVIESAGAATGTGAAGPADTAAAEEALTAARLRADGAWTYAVLAATSGDVTAEALAHPRVLGSRVSRTRHRPARRRPSTCT